MIISISNSRGNILLKEIFSTMIYYFEIKQTKMSLYLRQLVPCLTIKNDWQESFEDERVNRFKIQLIISTLFSNATLTTTPFPFPPTAFGAG